MDISRIGLPANDQVVVVVDPYSSGRFLVTELRSRGWPVVAVRSSLEIHTSLAGSWDPAPFEEVLVHDGNLITTVEALRAGWKIRAVIAGSEPGVELTDALAEALSLRGNGTALSHCRRNKYHMQERLREQGLRACAQRRCATVREAVDFATEHNTWPLIAKPCKSSGTDGVYQCEDESTLADAVSRILASKDTSGCSNEVVLVQEFLRGTEYVVDCVSLDGQHLVSAIWVYRKTQMAGGFAYERTQTVPFSSAEGSTQRRLVEYVFKCLTALGVRNGASHSEVMYNEVDGPCLVETGARMHGSEGPSIWGLCAGREQAQPFLVADVFTEDGSAVSRKLKAVALGAHPYELAYCSIQMDLQCREGGILERSIEDAAGAWIRSLPTFHSLKFFVGEGEHIEPTRDMLTSPGWVMFVGDEASAERDANTVRKAEREGRLYLLKPVPFSMPSQKPCGKDEPVPGSPFPIWLAQAVLGAA